jgi:hypothetical protein
MGAKATILRRHAGSGNDEAEDAPQTGRDELEPYLDELDAGLLGADDNVVLIPTKATMGPRLDALVVRAWSIVGRELAGTVVQQLARTSQLLYLWVASTVRATISRADREELTEGLHELVFTWVFANRADLLTRRETQELRQYWAQRQASALPPTAASTGSRGGGRRLP